PPIGPVPLAIPAPPFPPVPPTPPSVTVTAVPGTWAQQLVDDLANGTIIPSAEIAVAGPLPLPLKYTFGDVAITSVNLPPAPAASPATFSFTYKTIAVQR